MPTWRALLRDWPHASLGASEEAVGLPAGQMGNSEVGHLNLGAGRPVLQDLPRIDAAIADGSFFERPAFLEACARARETRGHPEHRQPRRPGRRPRQRPAPRGTGRARATRAACRSSGSTRCSTGATPRPRRRSASSSISSAGWRPPIRTPPSRRSAGGTGRWTATPAGTGSSAATTPSSTARRRITPRRPSRRSRPPTPAARPTSSSRRPSSTGSKRGWARGEPIIHANFRADRARQLAHALADGATFEGFDRSSPSGRPAPSDLLVVTMTEYEAGLAGPRRLPARGVAIAGAGLLRGRLAPAPRRRDREVRPRDVLLQRRRRGAVSGRGAPARPEPAASRPTTSSPR